MTVDDDASADWSFSDPLDAREIFFIRHAARIRAWAALEREVEEHAEEFLVGLATDLRRSGGLLGLNEPGVVLQSSLDRNYPMVQLRRDSWASDEISVALQWRAKRVTFEGPRSPYVGVRIEGTWQGIHRRNTLTERLSKHRAQSGGGTDHYWPAYRTVPIPSRLVHQNYVDLAGYRDHLLSEFVAEWMAVSGVLDAVIREVETIGEVEG